MKKLLITAFAAAAIAGGSMAGGVAHAAPGCGPENTFPGYPPCTTEQVVAPPTVTLPETGGNDPSSSLFIGATVIAVGAGFIVVARRRRHPHAA